VCVTMVARVRNAGEPGAFKRQGGGAVAGNWKTGVMVADKGPLYAYVDIPLRICRLQLQ
jgi:hypothetical protein